MDEETEKFNMLVTKHVEQIIDETSLNDDEFNGQMAMAIATGIIGAVFYELVNDEDDRDKYKSATLEAVAYAIDTASKYEVTTN